MMDGDLFLPNLDLSIDLTPICFLFRFIIQGFIRVYSEDIYQLRLSNVLLSKTGASGIRTALLTLSSISEKKRKHDGEEINKSDVAPCQSAVNDTVQSNFVCLCGKEYQINKKGWYLRHIIICPLYQSGNNFTVEPLTPPIKELIALKKIVELECSEEQGDYAWDTDPAIGINLERESENTENDFNSNFISELIFHESDDN